MEKFQFDLFRDIVVGDAAVLEPALVASEPLTCESNFLNLFVWQKHYSSKFQIFEGRPYAYLLNEDELLFPGKKDGEYPPPAELAEISRVMAAHGKSGIFYQTPADYLTAMPDYSVYFRAEQIHEDYGEYIYNIEDLVELRGAKLHKKKNLISQFERLYSEVRILPFSKELIPACRTLLERWSRIKEAAEPDEIRELEEEHAVIERAFAECDHLHMTGCCVFVGELLVAFAICSRVNSEMFTVHFEKNDPAYKGSGQVINREMARMLSGQGTLINREQDLGVEGLRHAKSSYAPVELLRNYSLIPLGTER